MQYRSKKFDQRAVIQQWEQMPVEERQRLIDEYVREEVLYRRAINLGLLDSDYVIRKRLLQKIEFISEEISKEKTITISDAMLAKYFAKNHQRYYIKPTISFTHVFFGSQSRSRVEAKLLSEQKLYELNAIKAKFSESSQHGDRFPYYLNYVERTYEEIASHFGDDMMTELKNTPTSKQRWSGPYESEHGFHVVMVSSKMPGQQQPLASIRRRIEEELRATLQQQAKEDTIGALVKNYEVVVELDE